MTTELLKINPAKPDAEKIRHAASALKKGGLVVFPTETVYGIGANAENKKALSRLRRLKERPEKPFSFHIALKSDLKKLGCVVTGEAKRLMDRFWPGPLTLVLNTKSFGTIAVRMPMHPVALALLKKAQVLVVAPSANFKGKKPAVTGKQAVSCLSGFVDAIIDAGSTKIGTSSTVLDLTQTPPKILRKGSVGKSAIEKLIGKVAG